jgi:WD40 repeat protein
LHFWRAQPFVRTGKTPGRDGYVLHSKGRVRFDPGGRHAYSCASDYIPEDEPLNWNSGFLESATFLLKWDLEAGVPVWANRINACADPSVSPDGRSLVVLAHRPFGQRDQEHDNHFILDHEHGFYVTVLRLVDVRSGLVLGARDVRASDQVAWLPDGRLLLTQPADHEHANVINPALEKYEDLDLFAKEQEERRVETARRGKSPGGLSLETLDPAEPFRDAGLKAIDRVVIDAGATTSTTTPDGRHLLIGGGDGIIRIREAVRDGPDVATFTGHAGKPVQLIRVAPDNQRVLSVAGLELAIWDLSSPEEAMVRTRIAPKTDPRRVGAMDASGDWRWVLIGTTLGEVILWDLVAGEIVVPKETFPSHELEGEAVQVLFSPDWRSSLTLDEKGTMRFTPLPIPEEPRAAAAEPKPRPVEDGPIFQHGFVRYRAMRDGRAFNLQTKSYVPLEKVAPPEVLTWWRAVKEEQGPVSKDRP